MGILVAFLVFPVAIAVLVLASSQLVTGAARVGVFAKVSPVAIGALVVGFGTSLPEMVVSAISTSRGQFDVAVGNIAGSNVANLLLVLGAAAIVSPTLVSKSVCRRELPASFAAVVLFAVSMRFVSFFTAAALALAAVLAVWFLLSGGEPDLPVEDVSSVGVGREVFRTLLALAALVASSHLALTSALTVAEFYGLSAGVVGAVILAVGTSLPELAASVAAARKGAHGIIVGTLLGSNMMNSLVIGSVIAFMGSSRDLVLSVSSGRFGLLLMVLAVAVASMLVLRQRVSRLAGAGLLSLYVAFAAALVLV